MAEDSSTERILDKLDELRETNKGISDSIQKLLQYILVIGALNGSVNAGKLVTAITEAQASQPIKELGSSQNVGSRTQDSGQAKSSETVTVD